MSLEKIDCFMDVTYRDKNGDEKTFHEGTEKRWVTGMILVYKERYGKNLIRISATPLSTFYDARTLKDTGIPSKKDIDREGFIETSLKDGSGFCHSEII